MTKKKLIVSLAIIVALCAIYFSKEPRPKEFWDCSTIQKGARGEMDYTVDMCVGEGIKCFIIFNNKTCCVLSCVKEDEPEDLTNYEIH
jgi:hypothetical protein